MLIAGIGIANTLLSFINQKTLQLQYKKQLNFSGNIKTIYYIQLSILLIFVSVLLMVKFFTYTNHYEFISDGLGLNITKFSIINFTKIF